MNFQDISQLANQIRPCSVRLEIIADLKLGVDLYRYHNPKMKKLLCDQCIFVANLPRILRLHQLLGCKNEISDRLLTSNLEGLSSTNELATIYTESPLINKFTSAFKRNKPSFTNKKILKLPKTKEKTFIYSCDSCSYESNRLSHLRQHKFIHTGEKPFSCKICAFKCNRAISLKRHKMIHTGEKRFSCDVCNYKCNRSGNLKTHKMAHTLEKPFHCDHCDYKCNQLSHLKTHKFTHSGEKRFTCSDCKFKCYKLCNLKVHQTRKHLKNKQSLNNSRFDFESMKLVNLQQSLKLKLILYKEGMINKH